jgi:hypothetical protein
MHMQRNYVIAGVAIVLIVLASIVVATLVTRTSAPTTILVEPENVGQLAFGDTFTVNVTAENCVNVFAVQIDLRYDPTVLNVTNIVEGPFLPSISHTIPLIRTRVNLTDTFPCTVDIYFGDTLLDYSNGTYARADGNGVLLTITFKVVGGGTTELQLFRYDPTIANNQWGTYFLDRHGNNILPKLQNGTYGASS